MELRHLRYMVAVAEERNFHRASSRLRVAQSALSRRIADLEAELDVKLFERSSRGVSLSQAGLVFLEQARRIITDVERAKARMRGFSTGETGILKIGLNLVGVQLRFTAELFQAFRSRYPGVDLQIVPLRSAAQIQAIGMLDIDVGFSFHRPRGDPEYSFLPFQSYEYLLTLPPDHRLAAKKAIRLSDLKDESFILFPRDYEPMTFDMIMAALRAGGLRPNVVEEVADEDMQLGLVSVGRGVGLANSSNLVRRRNDRIVYRKVSDFTVRIDFDIVWGSSNRHPALKTFTGFIPSFQSDWSRSNPDEAFLPPGAHPPPSG